MNYEEKKYHQIRSRFYILHLHLVELLDVMQGILLIHYWVMFIKQIWERDKYFIPSNPTKFSEDPPSSSREKAEYVFSYNII